MQRRPGLDDGTKGRPQNVNRPGQELRPRTNAGRSPSPGAGTGNRRSPDQFAGKQQKPPSAGKKGGVGGAISSRFNIGSSKVSDKKNKGRGQGQQPRGGHGRGHGTPNKGHGGHHGGDRRQSQVPNVMEGEGVSGFKTFLGRFGLGGEEAIKSAQMARSSGKSRAMRRKKRKFARWKIYTVFAASALIFITGIIMIVMGSISLHQQKQSQTQMNLTFNVMAIAKVSSIVVVTMGVTSLVASIIGLLGALYHSRYALGIYCMIVFILFAMMFLLAIVTLILKHKPETITAQLSDTMILYRTKHIRHLWDDMQIMFQCCGLHDGKGVQEWKNCYKEMLKKKGYKDWKKIPGISKIPNISKFNTDGLNKEIFQILFPFMYPTPNDYDKASEEDDSILGNLMGGSGRRKRSLELEQNFPRFDIWKNSSNNLRAEPKKPTKPTTEPSTLAPSTSKKPPAQEPGQSGGDKLQEIVGFFTDPSNKGALRRLRNYFNFVPTTCCKNKLAYQKYNETTIKRTNKTICAFVKNKDHVWQDGCVKKICAKFQRVSITLFCCSALMMAAIVAATFVIVTPDKYLEQSTGKVG